MNGHVPLASDEETMKALGLHTACLRRHGRYLGRHEHPAIGLPAVREHRATKITAIRRAPLGAVQGMRVRIQRPRAQYG